MSIKFLTIVSFISLLTLNACQEEVIEITSPAEEDAFTGNSEVAGLIKKIGMRDGSSDNILDQASCISFMLPITVVVNGQEMIIRTEDDYDLVEEIFDELNDDEDSLVPQFPITVLLADHSSITVHNEDELEDLIEECIEEGADDDIECIDFKYPLELSVYNATTQQSDIVTLENDMELYIFFDQLEDDTYLSFNFPVTLIKEEEEILINDNKTLAEIIDEARDDCDEDDDNDYNDDDIDDTALRNVLLSSEWKITHLFNDGNRTADFKDFKFRFTQTDSILAINESDTIMGAWESDGNSGKLILELYMASEEPWEYLEEDWEVVDFSDLKIDLKAENGVNEQKTLILSAQ